MGVYAAMSGGGAAVGLVAGGLLTTYLSWRWVLFVNVPIGVLVALVAPYVLAESSRQRGRFDLPGAITGTAGVALLVYGLSNATTDSSGVSHWGDTKVVASLVAAALLLVAFGVIEARSRHALCRCGSWQHLPRRAARADADHLGRPGHAVRPVVAARPDPCPR